MIRALNVAFLVKDWDSEAWLAALAAALPEATFLLWPDQVPDPDAIDYAVVWSPPKGVLAGFAKLKGVLNLGAGVDLVLADDTRPKVPLVRLVDPALTAGMSEYVIHRVLHYHRSMPRYEALQRAWQWRQLPQTEAGGRRVGILGLGTLGGDAAGKLAGLGFNVAGWSRTPKDLAGIACFAGNSQFDEFLARTDILVCLLPLTPETEGILCTGTFARLPRGSYLINAARGGHAVEDDIIKALDDGQLAGAALDVFAREPLSAGHPLWSHPGVIVTPHVASVTNISTAAREIATNIRRLEAGETPSGLVDGPRGY